MNTPFKVSNTNKRFAELVNQIRTMYPAALTQILSALSLEEQGIIMDLERPYNPQQANSRKILHILRPK